MRVKMMLPRKLLIAISASIFPGLMYPFMSIAITLPFEGFIAFTALEKLVGIIGKPSTRGRSCISGIWRLLDWDQRVETSLFWNVQTLVPRVPQSYCLPAISGPRLAREGNNHAGQNIEARKSWNDRALQGLALSVKTLTEGELDEQSLHLGKTLSRLLLDVS